MWFFDYVLTGQNLALLGAGLAVILAGIGSAKGVGMVGEASAGLLTEDPSKFGKAMLLQALPGSQGIYGLVTALVIVIKIGLLGGTPVTLTVGQGLYFLVAALPIAIAGYASAIKQAKVSVAGIHLIAKRPDEYGKAIASAALVETYAVFALLVSLLPILFAKF
ncbi:MAG: V-type ATP synthase subunit K [Ruminococcaceae bacterium]|nr:V-type ATP synthase subunit K [Oscillospiraceae bacterium]